MTLPPILDRLRASSAARWAGLVALSWLILRPALIVTISGDDLVNPFSVTDDYGPSPFAELPEVNRTVLGNGHFNFVGQSFGAVVFRVWAHIISWGVRYSFLYALTKLLVFVLVASLTARVLRTLLSLGGRAMTLWWSRLLVTLVLFTTLQIHIAWSQDPVASFPLSGYLSLAVGLWAFDLACRALSSDDRRPTIVAAVALCGSILYYEINVAVVSALVPIVVIHLRGRRRSRRDVLRTAAFVAGPALAMTFVLQRIAAAEADLNYTGTDVGVGDGAVATVLRATLGSLPASAWGTARDWLDTPLDASLPAIVTAVLVSTIVIAAFVSRRTPTTEPKRVEARTLVLLALAPITMWLAATVVQAATRKVQEETPAVGYVYNYYAYGSVGVVLAALLVVHTLPRHVEWRRIRPALIGCAVVFVAAQGVINEHVQREFDARLRPSSNVLATYTDERPVAERCAALEAWVGLTFLDVYYRQDLVDGINATYENFQGEPFCDRPVRVPT